MRSLTDVMSTYWLIAEGTSTISGIDIINRGYENIVEKLKGLGAKIQK